MRPRLGCGLGKFVRAHIELLTDNCHGRARRTGQVIKIGEEEMRHVASLRRCQFDAVTTVEVINRRDIGLPEIGRSSSL